MTDIQDALLSSGMVLDVEGSEESVYSSEVGKKSKEILNNLRDLHIKSNDMVFTFEDEDGEPLSSRDTDGFYFVDVIPIDRIFYSGSQEEQIRKGDLHLYELQQNIEKVDIVCPIHVVPFGQEIESDTGLPKFSKYILVDGQRRLEASRSLGRSSILCLVNTTIDKQLIDVYKGIVQNNRAYSFSEKVGYANRVKQMQRSMSVETLENFLGYQSGEFLKSLYIDQMKVDYPDIYSQIEKGKLTIEQGFKRLEKEIEKAEKALEEASDLSEDDINDELRGKSEDLTSLQMDTHTQDVNNRHILDANLRRSVESRDQGTCQCCGFGFGEDDFMGGFNAHHIIPVMYQGEDGKYNLILLCKNCHGFVHDYETGRFNPDKHTYDKHLWVKKVVVLGNMLRKLRTHSMKEIARVDAPTYNLLQKGKISLGQAIVKSNIQVDGMALFNDDPYQTFVTAVEDLDFGGGAKGEFGSLENFLDETVEEQQERILENHQPRLTTTEDVLVAKATNVSLDTPEEKEDENKIFPQDEKEPVDDSDDNIAFQEQEQILEKESEEFFDLNELFEEESELRKEDESETVFDSDLHKFLQ